MNHPSHTQEGVTSLWISRQAYLDMLRETPRYPVYVLHWSQCRRTSNVGISHLFTMNIPPATHDCATTPAVAQADTDHGQHYSPSTSYTMGHPFYAGMLQSNTTRTASSLTYISQNQSSTNSLHRRPSLFRSRRPNQFSPSRARGSSAVRTLPQLGQT
jgi:hypothetical protein